jgi:hypothetical protein
MKKLTKIANINPKNQWKILGHYESTSTYFSNSNKKTIFHKIKWKTKKIANKPIKSMKNAGTVRIRTFLNH